MVSPTGSWNEPVISSNVPRSSTYAVHRPVVISQVSISTDERSVFAASTTTVSSSIQPNPVPNA